MKKLNTIEEIQNYLNEIKYPFSMGYFTKINEEFTTIKENYQEVSTFINASYYRNNKRVVDEISKFLSVIDWTSISNSHESGNERYILKFAKLLNSEEVFPNKLLKDIE